MKWFNWRNTTWGAYTFAVCAGVLLYSVLTHLGTIGHVVWTFIGFFTPVIYGLILAYIMDFIVQFMRKSVFKSIRNETRAQFVSVITTTLLVLFLIVLLMIALVPQIVNSVTGFFKNWNSYASTLTNMISSLGNSTDSDLLRFDVSDITARINEFFSYINNYVSQNSGSIISTVSSVGSNIATSVLSFILAIYFLFAKDKLLTGVKKMFKIFMQPRSYEKSAEAFGRINNIFSKYIICELVDSLIVGVATAIFMGCARMPYITLISVVAGITNLAPTFGPIAGAIIGAFILLLVDFRSVIPFLIFTIAIQAVDGYVIKPKMYGGALSVPSVWILVAIIVLGRMFGVAGILLAIPIAAVITYWIRDMINGRLSRMENPGSPADPGK